VSCRLLRAHAMNVVRPQRLELAQLHGDFQRAHPSVTEYLPSGVSHANPLEEV
jgi:hypothetical protein